MRKAKWPRAPTTGSSGFGARHIGLVTELDFCGALNPAGQVRKPLGCRQDHVLIGK